MIFIRSDQIPTAEIFPRGRYFCVRKLFVRKGCFLAFSQNGRLTLSLIKTLVMQSTHYNLQKFFILNQFKCSESSNVESRNLLVTFNNQSPAFYLKLIKETFRTIYCAFDDLVVNMAISQPSQSLQLSFTSEKRPNVKAFNRPFESKTITFLIVKSFLTLIQLIVIMMTGLEIES